MARRRTKALPRGIYARGQTYYIDFVDQDGKRRREAGGPTIEAAKRRLAERRRQVRAGTYVAGSDDLEAYANRWTEARRAQGHKSVGREEQILRDYVMPTFGKQRLNDIRPRDVAAWIGELELSPKSIRNVHGVLSSLLTQAVFDELLERNPARDLPRGVLPANVRSREIGPWRREEMAALMSDVRIPEDRRVAYSIASFTGARVGEIAGLRWEHIDTAARPLRRWALRTQYDGQQLKTGRPRDVPIHSVLAEILDAWRSSGWPRLRMRHPRPDDLVLPRADGRMHSDQSLGAKAVKSHARRIGIDPDGRDFHSFRRGFVTLARVDGAPKDVVNRITHNPRGEMIDVYTYFGWDTLCEAVENLRLDPAAFASVLELRHSSRHSDSESTEKISDIKEKVASPAGFEPASPA